MKFSRQEYWSELPFPILFTYVCVCVCVCIYKYKSMDIKIFIHLNILNLKKPLCAKCISLFDPGNYRVQYHNCHFTEEETEIERGHSRQEVSQHHGANK